MGFDLTKLSNNIIDIFSVLLPGFVATTLLYIIYKVHIDAFFDAYLNYPNGRLSVLAISSYLLGHILFLIGALLDDLLYDKLLKVAKSERNKLVEYVNKSHTYYNEVNNLLIKAVGIKCEDQHIRKQLEANILSSICTLYDLAIEEQDIYDRCELIISKKNLTNQLNTYFKQRNKLTYKMKLFVLEQIFSRTPELAVNQVIELKKSIDKENTVCKLEVNGEPVINAFQWSKAMLAINHYQLLLDVQRYEADSKFFRTFSVLLAVAPILTNNIISSKWYVLSLLCAILLLLSLYRYMERRYLSTEQAYRYLITLNTVEALKKVKSGK